MLDVRTSAVIDLWTSSQDPYSGKDHTYMYCIYLYSHRSMPSYTLYVCMYIYIINIYIYIYTCIHLSTKCHHNETNLYLYMSLHKTNHTTSASLTNKGVHPGSCKLLPLTIWLAKFNSKNECILSLVLFFTDWEAAKGPSKAMHFKAPCLLISKYQFPEKI